MEKLYLFLVLVILIVCPIVNVRSEDIHETDAQVDEVNTDYLTAEPSDLDSVYFYENFDDPDIFRKRWILSKAEKQDQQGSKYEGTWDIELPQRIIFNNDRGLVLTSKAKHAAISSKLIRPFHFQKKPLLIQYEVNFQRGMDCGGAYIKLLSQSENLDLTKFTDKTPYTIMFGPDKCGNDFKLHFIFRHKNPITGEFEEKHAKKATNRLEENFTDKKPHSYLLKLHSDNTFQIYSDNVLVNSGSLLEDMTPSVNPPLEIVDEKDKKPNDWDDRERIPDPSAKKPTDWDESAPATIPDPEAVKPDDWLEDEDPTIPDPKAEKPVDWDNEMDGEWEPPRINNPKCEGISGCGEWVPPQITNPEYKGKWKQPTIPNPNFKGKWSPRMIQNPNYYEDKEPFKMTSIGAVGIEIWTMTDAVLFDNFIITDNERVLEDWNSKTYDLKRRVIEKDSEGVLTRIVTYTNAHPWLWAVYLVVVALPLVLIITFCCSSSQDKHIEARSKKTDEYVEDIDNVLLENESAKGVSNLEQSAKLASASGKMKKTGKKETKEDLELDDAEGSPFEEEEDEDAKESGLGEQIEDGQTSSSSSDAEPVPKKSTPPPPVTSTKKRKSTQKPS